MKITFLPMNRKIDINKEMTIMELLRNIGIDIRSDCAGNRKCGKCKVILTCGNDFAFSDSENAILTEEEKKKGVRLACEYVLTKDTCIIIPKESQNKDSNIELELNKELIKDGDTYAVAFDIGTTTVECEFVNLNKKEKVGNVKMFNPQISYGSDIISRMAYSNRGIEYNIILHDKIKKCCEKIVERFEKESLVSIDNIIIVGNSVMMHLFAKKSLEKLAVAPFISDFVGGYKEKIFFCNRKIEITMLKSISGYIGSDILADILAIDLMNKKGMNLLIDIGTNAEIVLSRDGKMLASSTAAGPAFEGGNISIGMKAKKGAINRVKYDKKLKYNVIGEGEPIGICGSGIVDLIAESLKNGVIDENGNIERKELTDKINCEKKIILYENKYGERLELTQKDIREIQLAKSAVYTGIMAILKKANVSTLEIDSLYIAGSFGFNINIENAIYIGLLPRIKKNILIGNGALKGAKKVMFNDITLEESNKVVEKIEKVELANDDYFKEKYIKQLKFL